MRVVFKSPTANDTYMIQAKDAKISKRALNQRWIEVVGIGNEQIFVETSNIAYIIQDEA